MGNNICYHIINLAYPLFIVITIQVQSDSTFVTHTCYIHSSALAISHIQITQRQQGLKMVAISINVKA